MAIAQLRRVSEADIQALRKIVGPEHVRVGDEISDDYARDELARERVSPDVLVEPGCTREISEVMRYAYENDLPVTPRGTGTGLCGGAVATHGGIMLTTTRLNRILEIDQECLMATVEPGVVLLDFQKHVEKLGLFYPPDPGEKSATLGGNVSTNAGGMRAVKYGVTRDYVRGMEVVLPNGEVTEFGGKLSKNSSGYGLMHLMIGSEGTLGIITKIHLRLIPLPKKRVSLLVPFASLEEAIRTVPKVLMSRTNPTAIEFMQQDAIYAYEQSMGKSFPHSDAPAYLLLLFDGNSEAELEAAYQAAAETCLAAGALDALIADTSDRHSAVWDPRGAFLEALKAVSELEMADAVVPPHLIPEFVTFCDSLAERFGAKVLTYGHAGDGNCHIHILREDMDDETWERVYPQVMDEIYRKCHELGGQVSGEHGIGVAKRPYLHRWVGDTNLELMRQIKKSFDPKGVLNPGKVV
ncbi:MAG: FAD-binding oxidoreductase [Limnochordia bacterium]|jgi:glycolate oxidase